MKINSQKTVLLTVLLTISIVLAMSYSFYLGRQVSERYAPLIGASMGIRLEATTAHLLFDEMRRGGQTADFSRVQQYLDKGKWFAQAMLDGGENEEGHYLPIKDPAMRHKLEKVINSINKFSDFIQEKRVIKQPQPLSAAEFKIEARIDQLSSTLTTSASEVESMLQKQMAKDLEKFSLDQILLISAVAAMGIIVAIVLYRQDARRVKTMQLLYDREENLRITFNAIGDAVIVTDVDGNVTHLNPIAENLTGWLLEQAIGQPIIDVFNIINAQTLELAENPVEKVLATGKIVGLANHAMLISKNGDKFQIADSGAPIHSVDGEVTGVVLVFRDVTEEYALHEVLKLNQFQQKMRSQVLASLLESKPLASIFESIINIIEAANPEIACSILLLDEKKKHLRLGAAPHLPDFYNKAIDGLTIGDGVGCCGTAAFTGQRVIVDDIQTHPYWEAYKELMAKTNLKACWSEPIMGSNNSVLGTFAIYHHEISTPKQKDFELIEFAAQLSGIAIEKHQTNEQLVRLASIFSHAYDGIIITDSNKLIIDTNPAFSEITGYRREEVTGEYPSILSSGKQSPEFYADMWQQINDQGYWQGEIWNRRKDGEIYAERLTISSLVDDKGDVSNYVGIFTDITQSKQQQEKLNLMAHYDVLTGLPNRALFVDRFQQAIAHSKRTERQLAICFLDLDNFKPVNDNYGHDIGDELLVEVAERISANIREEDTVSRQGGDEFALLLNDIESFSQCEQTLKRIHHALAQPYIIDGYPHNITASSGITLYPDDDGDIDTLLRHADQAMYQAKVEGKHRYHLFNPDHEQVTIQKHHQLDEIDAALANNELQLYYQPKVNMVTGEVFGAEALLRWLHPEKGLIPPLEFLPVLEGTELEIKVGNWIINQALHQLEIWHKLDIRPEVSVNISSHHLLSSTFFEQLDAALEQRSTVNSQCLQLEILESSALGDLNTISHIIKRCQSALGISVALDDFGTGYSSLTHLRSLTANTIKIDQSFVRDILDDPSDYSIIDGVIGLAESFSRDVIAEGVETTAHGFMLLIMGCEQAQGYSIAKPMPADDFPQWLADYTPNKAWQACGNKHRNHKEKKVKLLRLVTEQWQNKAVANILASPESIEHWPIMNSKHCHCGTWIKQAQKERMIEQEKLNALEQAHDRAHKMANGLLVLYQQGDIDGARDGMDELKTAFNDLNYMIGLL